MEIRGRCPACGASLNVVDLSLRQPSPYGANHHERERATKRQAGEEFYYDVREQKLRNLPSGHVRAELTQSLEVLLASYVDHLYEARRKTLVAEAIEEAERTLAHLKPLQQAVAPEPAPPLGLPEWPSEAEPEKELPF